MTVYVDNMHLEALGRLGRMKMCHMIADTDEELHAMADKIGVQRKWFQRPGSPRRHYDIAMSKRAAAVAADAVEITLKQAASMTGRRVVEGVLGLPEEALTWRLARSPAARLADGLPTSVSEA